MVPSPNPIIVPNRSRINVQVISPLILVLSHSCLASLIALFVVFYWFPHNLYFATPLYLIAPVLFFVTNYLIPVGTRLFPFKDAYLRTLVNHPIRSWLITIIALVAAIAWMLMLFDRIYYRYTYLRFLDEALSSIGVDGMALPEPDRLAKAFNAAPDRPEVPFILTRATRLLASDLQTPLFSQYNKAFLDSIDRDSVLRRFGNYSPPHRIAIGNEPRTLPRRDPIRFLTSVAFETNEIGEQQWALRTLSSMRAQDPASRLQAEIWKQDLADKGDQPDERRQILQSSIAAIDQLVNIGPGASVSEISFISDHIFQRGLDYVTSLKIESQALEATAQDRCRYSDDIVRNYERIVGLRRRLSSATDLLWWEPPGKLFMYYLYLYLGHQTIDIGLTTIAQIDSCPGLMTRLQRMYDAPALRNFQDPDSWTQGTPISPAFNGSAGVRQLREWLTMGW